MSEESKPTIQGSSSLLSTIADEAPLLTPICSPTQPWHAPIGDLCAMEYAKELRTLKEMLLTLASSLETYLAEKTSTEIAGAATEEITECLDCCAELLEEEELRSLHAELLGISTFCQKLLRNAENEISRDEIQRYISAFRIKAKALPVATHFFDHHEEQS